MGRSAFCSLGLHAALGALLVLTASAVRRGVRTGETVEVDLGGESPADKPAPVTVLDRPDPAAPPPPEAPTPEAPPRARAPRARTQVPVAAIPPAVDPQTQPGEPEQPTAPAPVVDDGELIALAANTLDRRSRGFSAWRPRETAAAAAARRETAYARGLAAAGAVPRDPRYFGYRGGAPLDLAALGETPPERRTGEPPTYPAEAVAKRISGTATLRVCIDPTGRVSQVQTQRAPPFLGRAAAAAVMGWRYEPFVRAGGPHAACFPIRFEFTLGPHGPPHVDIRPPSP